MLATRCGGQRSCRWEWCAKMILSHRPFGACPVWCVPTCAWCVAGRPTSRGDWDGHCLLPGQHAGGGVCLSARGQAGHQVQRKVQGDWHEVARVRHARHQLRRLHRSQAGPIHGHQRQIRVHRHAAGARAHAPRPPPHLPCAESCSLPRPSSLAARTATQHTHDHRGGRRWRTRG